MPWPDEALEWLVKSISTPGGTSISGGCIRSGGSNSWAFEPRFVPTYKKTHEMISRAELEPFAAALNSSPRALRRDECGDIASSRISSCPALVGPC